MNTARPSILFAAFGFLMTATVGLAQVVPPQVPPLPAPAVGGRFTQTLQSSYGGGTTVTTAALPNHAVKRLGSARFRTSQSLRAAYLTPDGKYMLAGSYNQILKFEAKTGKQLKQINRSSINFQNFAITPDAKYIALSQYNNSVQILDATTGTAKRNLIASDNQARFQEVEYSPNGQYVAACPQNYYSRVNINPRKVHVWDAKNGREVAAFSIKHTQMVKCTFSPDSKMLATYGNRYNTGVQQLEYAIELWDVKNNVQLGKLEGNRGYVTSVAFSPNGRYLAAVSGRATVNLWDLKKKKILKRFAGRAANSGTYGGYAKFSPDGKYLVVGNYEGMVQLWDTKTWHRTASQGPRCKVTSVAFTKSGKVLACGIQGQAVSLWSVRTGKSVAGNMEGHSHPVRAVAFMTGKEKRILSMDQLGHIKIWNHQSGELLKSIQVPHPSGNAYSGTYNYYTMAVSPNGKYFATPYNNTVRLIDLNTRTIVCDFEGTIYNSSSQNGIGFSPDSNRIAIVNNNATVSVWDINSGEELQFLRINKDPKRQISTSQAEVAFSPQGDRVAAATYYYDQNLRRSVYAVCLWNVNNGKELMRVNLASYMPIMSFSADGTMMAVASATNVILYNPKTGREIRHLASAPVSTSRYQCMAFSPDGRTLAAATYAYVSSSTSSRPFIYVWEVATGRVRCSLTGHIGPVYSLAYSPDGSTLASGSYDTTIMMWDMSGRRGVSVPKKPSTSEIDTMWTQLTTKDSLSAFRTIGRFVATPKVAIGVCQKHMAPAKGLTVTDDAIRKYIRDLDHPRYKFRARAFGRLKDLGLRAEKLLQTARKANPSEEVELRITQLLDKLEMKEPTDTELRQVRAIEILERIGTLQSRAVLTKLAAGAAGAIQTVHARAALERLKTHNGGS